MNSLSFPELLLKTGKSNAVSSLFNAVKEGKFPIDVDGCQGSYNALLTARLYSEIGGLFFVIVPQESDANELEIDLCASGIPCMVYPWWGTVPYREITSFSPVFFPKGKSTMRTCYGKTRYCDHPSTRIFIITAAA